MSTAATVNLRADQGARWYVKMMYRDPAGEPVDLSDYGAVLLVRWAGKGRAPMLELDETTGVALGDTGTIEWDIDAPDMVTFERAQYPYALHLLPGHDPDASFILLRGNVLVGVDGTTYTEEPTP